MGISVLLKRKADGNPIKPSKAGKVFFWVYGKLHVAKNAQKQEEPTSAHMKVISALKHASAELRALPKKLLIVLPIHLKVAVKQPHSTIKDGCSTANIAQPMIETTHPVTNNGHSAIDNGKDAEDKNLQDDEELQVDKDLQNDKDEHDDTTSNNKSDDGVCHCSLCSSEEQKLRFGSVLKIGDTELKKVALLHLGAEKGADCSVVKRTGGSFNRAHIIQFNDGSKYIIRVPYYGRSEVWTADDAVGYRSDVLTLRYIKKHTDIPVPDILAYSTTCDNDLGHPYMLMTFLEGIPAYKLWDENAGSPENDQWRRTMLKSLANTMSKLQNLRFATGGRLDFKTDDDLTPEIAPAYMDDGYDIHDPNHGLNHYSFFTPVEHDPKEYFKDLFKKWVAKGRGFIEARIEDQPDIMQYRYGHRLILKMLVNSIPFLADGDTDEDDSCSLISDRGGYCCVLGRCNKKSDDESNSESDDESNGESDDESDDEGSEGGEDIEAEEEAENTETDEKDEFQDSASDGSSTKTSCHDDSSVVLADTSIDTRATSVEANTRLDYVFAHTDLDLQNIFVNESGEVVGIIDWDNLRTKRCFQGWVSTPNFLKKDWMQSFIDAEPPKAWVWDGDIDWTPDHMEHYREVYAQFVHEARGDNEDWVYASKSHIFDAIEEALMHQDRTEGVVDMILRAVLPPRIDIDQYLLRIVDPDSGFYEGEDDWLKARFKKFLECKTPVKTCD